MLKLGGFQQGMDRAARETQRSMARIESSIKGAQRGFALFTRGLAAVGVGVGFGSIVRGISDATKEAIEFGDEIGKAMAKTGIGATELTELAFAAKQSEVELDTLTMALRNMQVVISDAAAGNKAAALALADLGLSAKELQALRPEEQFELIADRIAQFADEADRAALRQDIFKRAAEGLAPVMERGAAGIREMREEAQRLGVTLTEEQVRAFERADEAIDKMSASFDAMKRSIGGVIAEPLAEFFEGVTEAIRNSNDESLTFGDRVGLLVEAYKRAFADQGLFAGPQDLAAAYAKVTEEANKATEATKQFGSLSETLGLPAATPTRTRTPREEVGRTRALRPPDPAPYLREIALDVQRITVSATEQMYRDMDEATQTSMERQLAEWEQFTAQVQALVDAGRISQEEALARNAEKTDEYLQEIEITAERMTVPVQEAIEETSEFAKQAARNMQDAFADFLFDPFEDGLEGMLESFSQTLRRMAAEIVAAQLAEKFKFEDLFSGAGLFGGGGSGSGGLEEVAITAQRMPEAAGAAALTTAGTTVAAALSTAGATGAAALTTAGTALAASITTAGAAAAASIAAAATAGGAASALGGLKSASGGDLGWLFTDIFGMEKGGYLAPGKVAMVGESSSHQAAPELLVAGKPSPTAALQQILAPRAPLTVAGARIAGLSATGRQAPEFIRAGPSGVTVVPLREHLRERELLSRSDRRERESFHHTLTRHDGDSVRLERSPAERTTERFREWIKERERDRQHFTTHQLTFEKGGYVAARAASALAPRLAVDVRPWVRVDRVFAAAQGGKVDGPGTGTSDSIPARLSAGEFVVKAEAVRVPGVQALLERINDGSLFRGFAAGGLARPYASPSAGPQGLPLYLADGGLVERVAGPTGGREPNTINQQFVFPGFTGQMSRATEMQLTAAAARGARQADRHNN